MEPNLTPKPPSIRIASLTILEDSSPGLVCSCHEISCLKIAIYLCLDIYKFFMVHF